MAIPWPHIGPFGIGLNFTNITLGCMLMDLSGVYLTVLLKSLAAPLFQIEINGVKVYTIDDWYPVLSGYQSGSDLSSFFV